MYVRARALGDAASDTAEYFAWVSSVKSRGGAITAYPFHDPAPWLKWSDIFGGEELYGLPCEQWPMAMIYTPTGELRAGFTKAPDHVSGSGVYGYYAAPLDVLAWAAGGGLRTIGNGAIDASPDVKPDWYYALTSALGNAGLVVGGLVALAALSYLPRGKR